MSKNIKRLGFVWVVLFVAYNVVAFLPPFAHTRTFCTAYAFTVIAFALQVVFFRISFANADTMKKVFLGLPVLNIGFVYLIVQLIAGVFFMAKAFVPVAIAACVMAVILAGTLVSVAASLIGRGEVERIDAKVAKKRGWQQSILIDLANVSGKISDREIAVKLKKLINTVHYSDPMSNAELSSDEASIRNNIDLIVSLMNDSRSDEAGHVIAKAIELLEARNRKCKTLK
jgi:hypothetical protein